MPEPDFFRLLDANLNRVCEGLRVLEDWYRFACPQPELVSLCKSLRHKIRNQPARLFPDLPALMLSRRNSPGDCGPQVTDRLQSIGATQKIHMEANSLITANCKRIEEGLRSLEEISRQIGQTGLSDLFGDCRYQSYELERLCFAAFQACSRDDAKADLSGYFRGLYGITMADPVRGRDHVEVGRALLAAGVKVLQYRNKADDAGKMYGDCLQLSDACRESGALFIVNDRLDLAIAAGADGVHLGQEDLPPSAARQIIRRIRRDAADQAAHTDGRRFLIGLSTHNPEQAGALTDDIDYIGVGPVYATKTKPDMRCPVAGLDYVRWITGHISLPQVAIGGITPANLTDVLASGARCCALISSVCLQEDVTSAAVLAHNRIINEGLKKYEVKEYAEN